MYGQHHATTLRAQATRLMHIPHALCLDACACAVTVKDVLAKYEMGETVGVGGVFAVVHIAPCTTQCWEMIIPRAGCIPQTGCQLHVLLWSAVSQMHIEFARITHMHS